jgi:hypothetical protein
MRVHVDAGAAGPPPKPEDPGTRCTWVLAPTRSGVRKHFWCSHGAAILCG